LLNQLQAGGHIYQLEEFLKKAGRVEGIQAKVSQANSAAPVPAKIKTDADFGM
jgi:hypothetical protein